MTLGPPPYRPLRGAEPPHFVDRADEDEEGFGLAGIRASAVEAYRSGPSHPRFHQLVLGAAALGKTALLRALARQTCMELDWAVTFHTCQSKERALGTVAVEVVASMQNQWPEEAVCLSRALLVSRAQADRAACRAGCRAGCRAQHPAGRGVAAVPSVLAEGAEASWARLKEVLELGGRYADSRGRGLLIVFDDADCLGGAEAESLGHLARALARANLPVALLLSGGPLLGDRFVRTGNFSSTVWQVRLGLFDEAEAREALLVPAMDRGVDFEDEALELLCSSAGGSPLALQWLGFAAWSAARGAAVISVRHVEAAIAGTGPELAFQAS